MCYLRFRLRRIIIKFHWSISLYYSSRQLQALHIYFLPSISHHYASRRFAIISSIFAAAHTASSFMPFLCVISFVICFAEFEAVHILSFNMRLPIISRDFAAGALRRFLCRAFILYYMPYIYLQRRY